MAKQTLQNPKARPAKSPTERAARLARVVKGSAEKAPRGVKLIDFREPTAAVRAHAKTVGERVRSNRRTA